MNEIIEKFNKSDLIFIPLGGSGEIGMNCNLYHYKDSWLMVDLGVTFKDERVESADLFMPDLDFIFKRKDKLCGIILTHAHEDHIGAMPYLYEELNKVPIFTTAFTASVLKRKFISTVNKNTKINLLEYNKRTKLGPFDIEILALTHSIPEPNAVIIKTEKGNIFHTGDWKIDPTPLVGNAIDEKKINEITSEGIHTLVCDSTNVFNIKPSGSENDVRDNLKKVFRENTKGKIVITCFASNIARLETIAFVSKIYNRSCILIGRSLKRIYESAAENGYLTKIDKFLNEIEGKNLPDENTVIICTGSQGENRAALYKLLNGNNNNFNVNSNDLVIFSSREIPGNETQINSLKNKIRKIGCKILDHNNSMLHVSGHPSKAELSKMYGWVKPEILIPVHGEYQHLLEHSRFAKESGINSTILVENGDVVFLDNKKKSRIIEKVFTGRKALKGNRILPINKRVFDNQKMVNFEGEILIVIILDINDSLNVDPIIMSPTILDIDDEIEKDKIKDYIKELLIQLEEKGFTDNILEDYIRKKIRNYMNKYFGLKPLTEVKIIRSN